MQHKFAIGMSLMVFSLLTIAILSYIEQCQKAKEPAQEIRQPVIEMKEPGIPGLKSTMEVKKPELEAAVIPEKKQVKLPESDQIIIPKSSTEVYADYLEGFVVGKKNLGDTADSRLDDNHFYLYVKAGTGKVKMYRTTEAKFNMVNNGDRILYRKSKDEKILKVSDEKWK